MRHYEQSIPITQNRIGNDIYVAVTRKHAYNIGLAAFIKCAIFPLTALILYLALDNKLFLFALSLDYALYVYANALIDFTNEARGLLLHSIENDNTPINVITNQNDMADENGLTPIDNLTNGKIMLHIGLTQAQLEQIANTAITKGSLPVNYLQSLGLSRQAAERLRIELAQNKIVQFNDRDEAIITKDGKKIFSKIKTA